MELSWDTFFRPKLWHSHACLMKLKHRLNYRLLSKLFCFAKIPLFKKDGVWRHPIGNWKKKQEALQTSVRAQYIVTQDLTVSTLKNLFLLIFLFFIVLLLLFDDELGRLWIWVWDKKKMSRGVCSVLEVHFDRGIWKSIDLLLHGIAKYFPLRPLKSTPRLRAEQQQKRISLVPDRSQPCWSEQSSWQQ